jgi:ubiquinone/menaquinone biosynthesis C-methylase UbiE
MTLSYSFDRVVSVYDQTRGSPSGVADRVGDSLLDALSRRARLLETGIGTGRISKFLLARGVTVAGVDIAPKMLL